MYLRTGKKLGCYGFDQSKNGKHVPSEGVSLLYKREVRAYLKPLAVWYEHSTQGSLAYRTPLPSPAASKLQMPIPARS